MRKNLKKFLIDNDMTQKDLAEKLDITETHLSQVIKGNREASLKMINNFKEIYSIGSMDEAIEIWKDE